MGNVKVVVDQYDRVSELKAFDQTKTGVKGLVDAGVTKVPRIFINENDKPTISKSDENEISLIPTIDLKGINDDSATRAQIVKKVKEASERSGIFQIINHELPLSIMDEMIEGVRRFNEQDAEVKKKYYTRDRTKRFQYNSNMDIYTEPTASWKDNLLGRMVPNPPHSHELPDVCRDIMFEYTEYVTKVGNTVYELLSEALGLEPSHLKEIGCVDSVNIVGNYYPACPEPELTFGITSHVDYGLLAILLQDKVGGLQFLYQHQWIDVPVVSGGLIINVGDFIQLITNDKFKSVRHRALANKERARISVATFMTPIPSPSDNMRLYGPIKELVTEDEPAIYKDTTFHDFLTSYYTPNVDGTTAHLKDFKL
ncbi:hypothetical protein RD792_012818 [Penstemon davidsonii]|uniref:Fe2OG dioxygenase domain-containing protein n=1 Tax=Penstemon davidsonii TaxID=160366 RepID=A0ABR0CXY7_9LAMI|nr:hypothetical protein RD792_012818 [Penstemon davidsonii]